MLNVSRTADRCLSSGSLALEARTSGDRESGGASRARTDGLVVANDALSQLSYSPTKRTNSSDRHVILPAFCSWAPRCTVIRVCRLILSEKGTRRSNGPFASLTGQAAGAAVPTWHYICVYETETLQKTLDECPRCASNLMSGRGLDGVYSEMFAQLNPGTSTQRRVLAGSLALHGLLFAWLLHTPEPQLLMPTSVALGRNGKVIAQLYFPTQSPDDSTTSSSDSATRGVSPPATGTRETDLETDFRARQAARRQRHPRSIWGRGQREDRNAFEAGPWRAGGTSLRICARRAGLRR